jgi:transmembrane sensor
MSDPSVEFTAAMSAKEIERLAAAWLERREREDWSGEDQAALDSWLAESVAHRVAFVRVDAAWGRTEWLGALRPFTPEPGAERKWNSPLRIAAAIAIAVLLGSVAAAYLLQPTERTFTTQVGGHETIAFADGSRIELNTDTVLRARMTTASRTLWLDKGEAYFQVRHDPAHPFIVMAGDHRVTDLGTKFLVRRDPGRLEVALLEGRVRFGAADGKPQSQSALMVPGDIVTATASTVFLTKESDRTLARDLSWRHGVLVFDNTPLADAAREFNRYNREKLIIADPAVASMTIDGTFPANNAQAFARVVRNALGLRIEKHGDESVILR